ncbi:hypothetical protein R5H30_20580 [Sulfitobacter sp. D35]|uniref:hypothetical protein n=1 Tax=Sulfitobacter sp. D35 TaxID=3083252 RepID=UPI00296ED518|nr:hypothetical protein [Sulfitobacter sp. D35]MDW4500397.1 hypothetical protein [Sulfitobacter sp. D35]
MDVIRPEARAALLRWREALVGGALVLLGLWWLAGPGGIMVLPALGLLAAGLGLLWVGVQRGRFRGPSDGVGAVQVDEGRVYYLGPLTGGSVALRELERLTLLREPHPAHWRLDQPGQPPLMIPVNAAGTDALFDAFATLPGLRTERMLQELQSPAVQGVVIWERRPSRPAEFRLH